MNENTKPTLTLTDDSAKAGEFKVELQYCAPEQTLLDQANLEVSASIYEIIKDRVKREIPSLLSYANFLGEAETYMVQKGIPFNKKIREEYAKAFYDEFIASLEDLVTFDDKEGTIALSPYIFALEHGDFYRPAVGFLSDCINQWISELEKASEDS